MLAGRFEQSSAHLAMENRSAEASLQSPQQIIQPDERLEPTTTKNVADNPGQHAKHNHDEELVLEPGHLGNNDVGDTINIPRMLSAKRPPSSKLGKLLIACDNAVEQGRKPANFHLTHERPAFYAATEFMQPFHTNMKPGELSNTTQCLELAPNTMCPPPRPSYSQDADHIMDEYTASLQGNRQYQGNLSIHNYPTQKYDQNHRFYIGHEQEHNSGQQQGSSRVYHADHHPQYEQEDSLYQQTSTLDSIQPMNQQSHVYLSYPQDCVLQQDNQIYHQASTHPYDQYHVSATKRFQHEYYPNRESMMLPNSTLVDRASASVYEVDGTAQQFIPAEGGYEQHLEDEESGIEEELDHELYGQFPRAEEAIEQGDCELSVVPDRFWRPRRLY